MVIPLGSYSRTGSGLKHNKAQRHGRQDSLARDKKSSAGQVEKLCLLHHSLISEQRYPVQIFVDVENLLISLLAKCCMLYATAGPRDQQFDRRVVSKKWTWNTRTEPVSTAMSMLVFR